MRFSRAQLRSVIVGGLVALAVAAIWFSRSGDRSATATPELDTSTSAGQVQDPAPARVSPGTAALRASIDPETGELVQGHVPADKAEDAELQNMLSRSTEGLVQVYHPDGRVSVNLEGRFQNASVARINADGQLETTCVETSHAAHAFCRGEATDHASHAVEVR